MASFVSQLPAVFLLFLAFSSPRSHARESRFFSKVTRSEGPKEAAAAPAPAPDKIPATGSEEPTALPPQSHNGYGLYGHGPDRFTISNYDATHMHPYANHFKPTIPESELAGESHEKKENVNGGRFSHANNFHSKSPNEEFNVASYEHKAPDLVWPNGISDIGERYGMSDTRFLENGRSPYDGAGAMGGNYRYEGYRLVGRGDEYGNAMGRYQNGGENRGNPDEYVP